MSETTLTHWGILGMKWGVRRYQNEDGTLTEAGKKRYAADVLKNRQKSKKNRIDDEEDLIDARRWVEEDITRSKNITDSGKSITNELSNLERQTRSKNNKRMDLSKMSDAELRNTINREMLERQYNQMFNAPEVSKGRQVVSKVLEIGGTTLALSSSALGIALMINQLKAGKT